MTLRKAEYLIDISQKIVIGDISKSYYQTFQTAESAEKAMVKLRELVLGQPTMSSCVVCAWEMLSQWPI
ncbi:hypothetical protein [Streptococcus orisratti]|uniref:hypothetical protein n=1 Tax=Streptococcus orisratti TaxID=114652 RepID=UPI003CFEA01A